METEMSVLLSRARHANYRCGVFAKLCGMSIRKLQRIFPQKHGLTPKRWLNNARQHAALELLRDGCSVTEAAHTVNYTRQENFSRDFKKFFGVPPSQIDVLPVRERI